ncbi:elongation factor P maturation arginine rhamnosyltransferase EarP [Piscinibacter terrae]|uniref:Protein-arginine rhamnosyltransferase n=1 Tax=Piscinibacter terrae TaxID=2496871 RepID=A0A3N7HJ15_9BURK|nr:elongation factor P maturation arginine rhamnosyltransferase EarP [Albitalea terrae]RQP22028.1 elongation factor P maturation arginine rhamnosyltransferase EarP [Albitalea terrae]
MLWDIFCRVVDNFGDIGVCWRAAADLASRGERVRLWVDDGSALAWMAPQGHEGVEVRPWPSGPVEAVPGDVVVEAFGCHLPDDFMARMAAASRPPVWINLEYLSAEPYVERSHRLMSPQMSGPGKGLVKWFFYPGFTAATGGLIREPDLMSRQARFEPGPWLASRGLAPRGEERIVSLFCYPNPAVAALLDRLCQQPTLLLATSGHASEQVAAQLGPSLQRGHLRALVVPRLTQPDYDHLLWSCDLNFVRGEDSFVRAQWAGKPFVWHIYPQDDGVHGDKLTAFEALFLQSAEPGVAAAVHGWHAAWNGLGHDLPALAGLGAWTRQARAWRESLLSQPDLVSQLRDFAIEKR